MGRPRDPRAQDVEDGLRMALHQAIRLDPEAPHLVAALRVAVTELSHYEARQPQHHRA